VKSTGTVLPRSRVIVGVLVVGLIVLLTAGHRRLADVGLAVRGVDGTIVEAGVLDRAVEGGVRVGDCLVEDIPASAAGGTSVDAEQYVTGVPCTIPHDHEVFAELELFDLQGLDVDDAVGLQRHAEALCAARLSEYAGRRLDAGYVAQARRPLWWSPDDVQVFFECWVSSSDGEQLVGTLRSAP
jgi:hypothetical protein